MKKEIRNKAAQFDSCEYIIWIFFAVQCLIWRLTTTILLFRLQFAAKQFFYLVKNNLQKQLYFHFSHRLLNFWILLYFQNVLFCTNFSTLKTVNVWYSFLLLDLLGLKRICFFADLSRFLCSKIPKNRSTISPKSSWLDEIPIIREIREQTNKPGTLLLPSGRSFLSGLRTPGQGHWERHGSQGLELLTFHRMRAVPENLHW